MRTLVLALALAASACSSEGNVVADAGTCAAHPDPSCAPAPAYADVASIVERTCLPCHTPDGVAADQDLRTQAALQELSSTVLSQITRCSMPPADAGTALGDADRALLLDWLECGAH